MKAEETKFHVLGLSPRQQMMLRILLYNLYCGFIDKSMRDVYQTENDNTYKVKTQMALSTFERYNQVIDLLANRSTIAKAKSKLLTIAPVMMKNIMIAVHGFDQENCYLDKDDINYIKSGFNELHEKITESIKHTYTMSEIEKIKGDL